MITRCTRLAGQARLVYEWCRILAFLLLAGAAHASNPIQIENALPGSPDWERSPWTSNHEIEGYASATSVARGQSIDLYVSTATAGANYVIEVYRIGWYGGAGARLVHTSPTLTGIIQPSPSADGTGLIECGWTNPYVLAIPPDWVSGIYLAKLTALNTIYQNYIIFVVRDDGRNPPSEFLYQAAVNTWQAYNNWGGKSLYPFNSDGGIQAQRVSFNRPYFADSGGMGDFPMAELNLVRFLEKEGFDVSYATNTDLHEQGAALIAPHKAFLSAGHDEYWSYQMKSAAQQARDQGKHIAFFGSNSVYWQARYEPSTLHPTAQNRTLVSYKESAESADPYYTGGNPANYKYVTTRFRDLVAPPYNVVDPVAQPENGLIGVMYHGDRYQGDIVVSNASHWAFANTGLSNGDHLAGMLGYETDSVFANGYSPAGLEILTNSPDGFDMPGAPDTAGYSNATIYRANSDALVFATGSIQWSWGLDDYGVNPYWTQPSDWGRPSYLSAAALQTTRNILNRFTMNKPGAPTITTISSGPGRATINFQPPASSGSTPVLSYTATCSATGHPTRSATGAASPITVTNLSGNVVYTCTLVATNSIGSSAASAGLTVKARDTGNPAVWLLLLLN